MPTPPLLILIGLPTFLGGVELLLLLRGHNLLCFAPRHRSGLLLEKELLGDGPFSGPTPAVHVRAVVKAVVLVSTLALELGLVLYCSRSRSSVGRAIRLSCRLGLASRLGFCRCFLRPGRLLRVALRQKCAERDLFLASGRGRRRGGPAEEVVFD